MAGRPNRPASASVGSTSIPVRAAWSASLPVSFVQHSR